ncbi:MAG: fibrinogen-like YCDxxxxGGGW domain-containing protein [Candidatus Paceibacterota bacterium]|jgi:prepilin-type N-terminal cleavage/methylation domain-containing protein
MNKIIKRAFTLIELLVVIAIIGILSGLVVISINASFNSANDAKRKASVDSVRKALIVYGTLNGGSYPLQTDPCNIGQSGSCSIAFTSAIAELLPNPPIDPVSGKYYTYSSTGTGFSITAQLSNSTYYSFASSSGFINNPSCLSILNEGKSVGSGMYWINPTGTPFQAYCDMVNDGGGWTLVTASMIQSELNTLTITTKTVDSNGGLIATIQKTIEGCGNPKYYQLLLKDLFPWTKIRADYEFYGGHSCWGVFGSAAYGIGSNIITYQSGVDTIRSQVKMGGTNGNNFDGITSRCDNEGANFWHGANDTGTRSAQVVLRRNSMSSYAGISTGVSCSSGNGWSYRNIYIR